MNMEASRCASNKVQILTYPKRTLVKHDMMIGTKAKQVPKGVFALMGFAQWLNVSTLSIAPAYRFNGHPADLTLIIVKLFDIPSKFSIANNPHNCA
jgi:hypothetical protein